MACVPRARAEQRGRSRPRRRKPSPGRATEPLATEGVKATEPNQGHAGFGQVTGSALRPRRAGRRQGTRPVIKHRTAPRSSRPAKPAPPAMREETRNIAQLLQAAAFEAGGIPFGILPRSAANLWKELNALPWPLLGPPESCPRWVTQKCRTKSKDLVANPRAAHPHQPRQNEPY